MYQTNIKILIALLVVKLSTGCATSSNLYHSHVARIDGYAETTEIERDERDSLLRIDDKLYIKASYTDTKAGHTCKHNNRMHLSFYATDNFVVDIRSFAIIKEDGTSINLNSFDHFIGNWEGELSEVSHHGSSEQILLQRTLSIEELKMVKSASHGVNINLLELTFAHDFGCKRERYSLSFSYRPSESEEFEFVTLYFSPISYRYISV